MATTIQIKEETKKALFLEKNRLEKEVGRSLTYDEVIEHLLSRTSTVIPKKTLEDLQGILGKEAKEVYRELREEYKTNEK
ncbi:MAG: hypothetical protein GOP50_07210 [Candidatus Heimdallarchaeota archaeon]|nr:hypothetical protein [Candidatus Heimdallarchaeota archaeon]